MRRAELFNQRVSDAWLPGVVRLSRGQKIPIDKGFNAEAARRWEVGAPDGWRAAILQHIEQGGNVGMVPPPGVVIIDCDNAAAIEFVRGFADEETPWVSRTPESAHFWFRFSLPPAAREWLSKGVTLDNGAAFDLRVPGKSQAVIPPSLHPSGTHYQWAFPLPLSPENVPDMPRELMRELIAAGLTHMRDLSGTAVPTGENAHDRVRDWIMAHVDATDDDDELYRLAERYARSYVEPMRPARFHQMIESGELRALVDGAIARRDRNELPRMAQIGQGDDRHVYFWENFFPEDWAHIGEWSAVAQWACWNGTVWQPRPMMGEEGFMGATQRFAQRLRQLRDLDDPNQTDHEAWVLTLDSMRGEWARTRTSTGPIARLTQALSRSSTTFDKHAHLWTCPGDDEHPAVTFDFKNQQRFRPRRDDYLMLTAGATFDPSARSEIWERFLCEAFPNEAIRNYVQTAAGYTLLGSPVEDVVFFLIGKGGSGKGTFISALESVFGEYAGVLPPAEIDDKMPGVAAGGANASMLGLRGKRIVTCTELSDRVRLGAKLKALSGGDLVNARGLYARVTTTYQPRFVIWLGGNFQPEAKAVDTGLTRRMRYIPMDETPSKRDPQLRMRLKTDPKVHSAVLNWALEGLQRYLTQGLITPPVVEDRSLRARVEASDIGPWIRDWVVQTNDDKDGFTPTEGYNSYIEWFLEMYHTRRGIGVRTAARFGEEMAALGYQSVKVRRNGEVIRVFRGLRILSFKERYARDNG